MTFFEKSGDLYLIVDGLPDSNNVNLFFLPATVVVVVAVVVVVVVVVVVGKLLGQHDSENLMKTQNIKKILRIILQ